jgi:hypothetical protein
MPHLRRKSRRVRNASSSLGWWWSMVLTVRYHITTTRTSRDLISTIQRDSLDTITGTQPSAFAARYSAALASAKPPAQPGSARRRSGCRGVSMAPCCSVNAAFLFAEPCILVVSGCAIRTPNGQRVAPAYTPTYSDKPLVMRRVRRRTSKPIVRTVGGLYD